MDTPAQKKKQGISAGPDVEVAGIEKEINSNRGGSGNDQAKKSTQGSKRGGSAALTVGLKEKRTRQKKKKKSRQPKRVEKTSQQDIPKEDR